MDGVQRCRVVVHGHVQGVYFRDTLARAARRHGVSGWVRNRPDGTVEAVFEGTAEAVQRLVEEARRGPPHARVARTDVREEPAEGLSGFRIV